MKSLFLISAFMAQAAGASTLGFFSDNELKKAQDILSKYGIKHFLYESSCGQPDKRKLTCDKDVITACKDENNKPVSLVKGCKRDPKESTKDEDVYNCPEL